MTNFAVADYKRVKKLLDCITKLMGHRFFACVEQRLKLRVHTVLRDTVALHCVSSEVILQPATKIEAPNLKLTPTLCINRVELCFLSFSSIVLKRPPVSETKRLIKLLLLLYKVGSFNSTHNLHNRSGNLEQSILRLPIGVALDEDSSCEVRTRFPCPFAAPTKHIWPMAAPCRDGFVRLRGLMEVRCAWSK